MSMPVRRRWPVFLGVLLLVGLLIGAWLWNTRPRVTEEVVRHAVVTTLQQEAPASFYVTGYLDLTATSIVENTKQLFPGTLGIDLGTTRATVRVPGRVSYGFDMRGLRPEAIHLRDDGVVEVTVPLLSIHAVEPDLSQLEVETSVGWARLYASSGRRVEQQALRFVQTALRQQAERHLATSSQPRINTAEALERLLTPVLEAAGMENPRFRFLVGPELVMEPEG
jgi:hypothetical protein